MRVVGGEAKGRTFRAPPGRSTRPTSDKVRQAIFTLLGSLPSGADGARGSVGGAAWTPGSVTGATVVDLFAGSGALGIEALSRGAARVTFVDAASQATATIQENLVAVGLDGSRATVVRSDVFRWLHGATPADLVLADPPYAFVDWPELAARLAPLAGLVVLESGGPVDLGPGWEVLRDKHYGGTVVLVAQPVRASGGRRPER